MSRTASARRRRRRGGSPPHQPGADDAVPPRRRRRNPASVTFLEGARTRARRGRVLGLYRSRDRGVRGDIRAPVGSRSRARHRSRPTSSSPGHVLASFTTEDAQGPSNRKDGVVPARVRPRSVQCSDAFRQARASGRSRDLRGGVGASGGFWTGRGQYLARVRGAKRIQNPSAVSQPSGRHLHGRPFLTQLSRASRMTSPSTPTRDLCIRSPDPAAVRKMHVDLKHVSVRVRSTSFPPDTAEANRPDHLLDRRCGPGRRQPEISGQRPHPGRSRARLTASFTAQTTLAGQGRCLATTSRSRCLPSLQPGPRRRCTRCSMATFRSPASRSAASPDPLTVEPVVRVHLVLHVSTISYRRLARPRPCRPDLSLASMSPAARSQACTAEPRPRAARTRGRMRRRLRAVDDPGRRCGHRQLVGPVHRPLPSAPRLTTRLRLLGKLISRPSSARGGWPSARDVPSS